MNLHNVTATKSNGKRIASVMFAGDHFDLITRISEMKEHHAQATVEGFTYVTGGGWSKMTAPVPTLELKFEDVELWNCGRNWVVKDGRNEFPRNSEHHARRVLCEMLEGI